MDGRGEGVAQMDLVSTRDNYLSATLYSDLNVHQHVLAMYNVLERASSML